ncbi:hypothetical protein MMC26_002964 [Xylographa opegraphella]|nr:hypothetical protein [Xylographa opegraphella]
MEEVPMKLRCSVCSLLAVGAVRMPCCEQNLCENCEANLDNECPVCLHSTVDKTLIKPNKTLRTTIKAFLKKKVMEKETQRKKDEAVKLATVTAATTTTSAVPEMPVADSTKLHDLPSEDGVDAIALTDSTTNAPETSTTVLSADQEGLKEPNTTEAQMDVPRPSIETTNDNIGPSTLPTESDSVDGSKSNERRGSGVSNPTAEGADFQSTGAQWPVNGVTGLAMSNGTPNMNGLNGVLPMDFSQMMQYMPNGMSNGMINAFPNMLGMPGMGMDPMAMNQAMSQSMYGGFGGPNMGINGMNGMNGMNMGMGFSAGQGAFGGFNGQLDAWNTGQDNYNANAYGANGMGGNFGIHAGHGGYNMSSHQGNFNQMNHQQYPNNDFHHGHNNHGFQGRGRGRRGYHNAGRGQGGYNAMNQGNQNGNANYEPFHHQVPPQASSQSMAQKTEREPLPAVHLENRGSPDVKDNHASDAVDKQNVDEEQMNKERNPGDENEETGTEVPLHEHEVDFLQTTTEPTTTENPSSTTDVPTKEGKVEEESEISIPMPIQTFISSDDSRTGKPQFQDFPSKVASMPPPVGPAIPQGPSAKYSQETPPDQSGWGRGAGRGFYRGAANSRGEYRGRGSAYIPNGNAIHASQTSMCPSGNFPPVAPIIPKGLGVEGAPTGPKALREGLPNTGIRGLHQKRATGVDLDPWTHPGTSLAVIGVIATVRKVHRMGTTTKNGKSTAADGPTSTMTRRQRVRESHDIERALQSLHPKIRVIAITAIITRKNLVHQVTAIIVIVAVTVTVTMTVTVIEMRSAATERNALVHQCKDESRKRRGRDRDEEDQLDYRRQRSRKRSRREQSVTPDDQDSRMDRKNRDLEYSRNQEDERKVHAPKSLSDTKRPSIVSPMTEKIGQADNTKSIPTGPRNPEKDHHTLEREARNRERLMKEMQRRAATEGTAPKRKSSGLETRIQRKPSYKYEDDENEEARTIRVEREREGARWS